jgi:hypothetical protein
MCKQSSQLKRKALYVVEENVQETQKKMAKMQIDE